MKTLTCLTSNVDVETYDLHSIFAGLAGDALRRTPKTVALTCETTIATQAHSWQAIVGWYRSNGSYACEVGSGPTPDQAINACLAKIATVANPEPDLAAILGYREVA